MMRYEANKKMFMLLFFILVALQASTQNIDSLVNSIRIKSKIPMVAVAVVKADSVLYMKAFGRHKKEDSIDNASVNDYMHLASNTKAMTAMVAAKLVEEGKISWETKFFDLFPAWKNKARSEYHNITLKELLSHRGKIQPYTKLHEYDGVTTALKAAKGNAAAKRKMFVEYIIQQEPAKPKEGQETVYSNAGYSVAALMLEKASGQSWEQLMTRIYTKELGLSLIFGWPQQVNDRQPWGYSDSLQPLPLDFTIAGKELNRFIEPAGKVSMPFRDYVKFVQLNLQGLQKEGQYLRKSTFELLHFGYPNSESLGWHNEMRDGARMSNHTGSAGFFFTGALIVPDRDISYIVIINKGDGKAAFELLNLLMKRIK